MHDDATFALPAETLTSDERLTALAAILASAIAQTKSLETNDNSPIDEDSALGIFTIALGPRS
jgi:hypothetical protein